MFTITLVIWHITVKFAPNITLVTTQYLAYTCNIGLQFLSSFSMDTVALHY